MSERWNQDDDNLYRRSRSSFARSGWVTGVAIGLPLIVFGVTWHLHQRARFHQLTAKEVPQTTSAPMPGGQEAFLLSRVALLNDSEPEFVSATVLPGIGMQLLQTAVAYDEAQKNLLSSVPLSDVTRVPLNSVNGASFHVWVGTQHLPGEGAGTDLVASAPASGTQNETLVDGGKATGTFRGTGALADVAATVEITLSGRDIDLAVRTTSHAAASRYVVVEWAPRFSMSGSGQGLTLLGVPSRSALQNGSAHSVVNTGLDFTGTSGKPVQDQPFNVRYLNLSRDFLGDGTFVRLQNNPGYFLRLQGMGESLRSLRVGNDPVSHTLLLGLSSLDPLADPEQRDQTLRPGQTLTWHLRMEVLPINASSSTDDLR